MKGLLRAIAEYPQKRRELAQLRARARRLFCAPAIEAMIARGETHKIGDMLDRAEAALQRAESLGCSATVGDAISKGDVRAAEDLVMNAQRLRNKRRDIEECVRRIKHLPARLHEELNSLLVDIELAEFQTLTYRRKLQSLRTRIADAEAAY